MTYSREVRELAQPIPAKYIERKPGKGGGDYVAHHVIEQRLIEIFGTPPRIEVLREIYDDGSLNGCVLRMTVATGWMVEEAGESSNPQSTTNGARLKDAISDAYKRCAMRLGCGLHLWAQEDYFLDHAMQKALSSGADVGATGTVPADSARPAQEARHAADGLSPAPTTSSGVETSSLSPSGMAPPDDVPGSVEAPAAAEPIVGTADPEEPAEERITSADIRDAYGGATPAAKATHAMFPNKSVHDLTPAQRRKLLDAAPKASDQGAMV